MSKSGIPGVDYCLNPYVGCGHGCRYCYATFMKRFTGHREVWGSFVDVKINASELLKKQLKRASQGRIMLSSVTDAYQPVEARYKLTRQCLRVLLDHQFPVDILTKSPLVLRDMDLFQQFDDIDVGITITTDDDRMRKLFAPRSPPIGARLQTLKKLHDRGITTHVFIGPLLPMNPEALAGKIRPYADSFLIDKMNYITRTSAIYRQNRLTRWLDPDFTAEVVERLRTALGERDTTDIERRCN